MSITKGNLKNFSSFGFLFARFIRLTPQLAIFLLLNFLLPLMASGPVWRELTDTLMDRCYKNWWLNVLYLQNFINVKEMVKFFSDYLFQKSLKLTLNIFKITTIKFQKLEKGKNEFRKHILLIT